MDNLVPQSTPDPFRAAPRTSARVIINPYGSNSGGRTKPVRINRMNANPRAMPGEIETHRTAARSLAQSRKFDEALAAWQRVEALNPGDAEAAEMIARLVIDQSRQRMGVLTHSAQAAPPEEPSPPNPQPSLPSATRPGARTAALPQSEFRRTPIQELEVAIREFPSNAEYYVQLVPLYLEKGREYDAERLLAKGREATGHEPRVCQLWEDVAMLRLQRKIALAQKHADEDDSPQAQTELAELFIERDRLETDIFLSRCQRDPDNAAVRIQLGQRLRRAGKLREARQRFEEALADPAEKCAAAFELGECAREMEDLPEALHCYRLAAASALQPRHAECKKRALHQAAQLAAKQNLHKLAQRYLQDLLRLDPNDKEAATLLKDLQQRVG